MLDTFSQLAVLFFPSEEILPSPLDKVSRSFRLETNGDHVLKLLFIMALPGICGGIIP